MSFSRGLEKRHALWNQATGRYLWNITRPFLFSSLSLSLFHLAQVGAPRALFSIVYLSVLSFCFDLGKSLVFIPSLSLSLSLNRRKSTNSIFVPSRRSERQSIFSERAAGSGESRFFNAISRISTKLCSIHLANGTRRGQLTLDTRPVFSVFYDVLSIVHGYTNRRLDRPARSSYDVVIRSLTELFLPPSKLQCQYWKMCRIISWVYKKEKREITGTIPRRGRENFLHWLWLKWGSERRQCWQIGSKFLIPWIIGALLSRWLTLLATLLRDSVAETLLQFRRGMANM